MTENTQKQFALALSFLPFQGITLKDFANDHKVNVHTLYNYISGQKPSERNYRYIKHILEQDYPKAL